MYVQLVSQNSKTKNHQREKVTSVSCIASKNTRYGFVSMFCSNINEDLSVRRKRVCHEPLRATMFHAMGLNAMDSRERSKEVLLRSTREWNWVRRTSIFLESIVNAKRKGMHGRGHPRESTGRISPSCHHVKLIPCSSMIVITCRRTRIYLK